LAEQLIDEASQSSSSIHLRVPLQRHPISRANQMPHHVPPLRLDRIYKSELQEHAPDKATRVHMSLRAAKLFILFVIWIPLHLMLCHSSTSRSASLRKLHQISSAAAAASFPCHNCKIIPQAGAVSRLPFFGSADKCNFIAFQLCTISGDDENEKTCSRPSTRNVRFAYIFDQAMNPEGTRESRRVSTQNFNVKARLHEHNSPVPPSKIKIAYERILITFAACRCVVFVPPVVPLPCITHNKVNIIIMHLLWPVITARNIECFPPLSSPASISYSSTYSAHSYHISEVQLGRERKSFFIHSNHERASASEVQLLPMLVDFAEKKATKCVRANFKLQCNSMWQIGFTKSFSALSRSLSYLEKGNQMG
jgi:hypothetical protein